MQSHIGLSASVVGSHSNCLKHWPVERDSIRCPSLSAHALGIEGWDGQLGQRPVIGDSMGCPLTARTSLMD